MKPFPILIKIMLIFSRFWFCNLLFIKRLIPENLEILMFQMLQHSVVFFSCIYNQFLKKNLTDVEEYFLDKSSNKIRLKFSRIIHIYILINLRNFQHQNSMYTVPKCKIHFSHNLLTHTIKKHTLYDMLLLISAIDSSLFSSKHLEVLIATRVDHQLLILF